MNKPKVLRQNGEVVGFQYGSKTVAVKATKKIKRSVKPTKKVKAARAKARKLDKNQRRH